MIQPEKILNARILIVEDDKLNRKLLSRILSSAGFVNVHAIPNARRLRVFYAKFRPDLLILDLNLPGISGFDAMQALREDHPDDYLPIMVISGEEQDRVHLRALASGAKDFLSKPYEASKVILRSRNLIEVRLLYKELHGKKEELEDRVRERTRELRETRIDVIRRLGYAAECRDTDTGYHIVRMSRYCECLARAFGLGEDDCEMMLATAPLHDIGKIAIPDSILIKPGPLTPEETMVMRTHATIGAEILSGGDSDFLRMAETIAGTHHERWDGGGYPRGLRGEAIPLPGRICSICDVFDALTSVRPYKKAWTVEDAVVEIRKMRGKNFDPDIVDMFMKILPRIVEIKRDIDSMARRVLREVKKSPEMSELETKR